MGKKADNTFTGPKLLDVFYKYVLQLYVLQFKLDSQIVSPISAVLVEFERAMPHNPTRFQTENLYIYIYIYISAGPLS